MVNVSAWASADTRWGDTAWSWAGLDVYQRWITVDQVKTHLGLTPFDAADDTHILRCVRGACAWLHAQRPELSLDAPVNPDISLGLVMLAAAAYDRRGSQGDASVGEWAGPGPLIDSTIMQLLGLGRYHAPVIA